MSTFVEKRTTKRICTCSDLYLERSQGLNGVHSSSFPSTPNGLILDASDKGFGFATTQELQVGATIPIKLSNPKKEKEQARYTFNSSWEKIYSA